MAEKIIISSQALSQQIHGDVVILDLSSASYFGLDDVGARFWELLQQESELSPILRQLTDEYDVEATQLKTDIEQLISQLSEAGLIHVE